MSPLILSFKKSSHLICCGQQETINHLIIYCNFFGNLWNLVKSWISVYSVDPHQESKTLCEQSQYDGAAFGKG
ncbi:hypothetical protein MTR_5g025680 [Medicago truncatula]|uniref:Reverse transcriptase zinc-binding domain-containing protein n=1 Tax=Medicago truncatula TaxID=3880 RepID=G7K423_MEDTR|nr:hypothetical protein MTR_5g025680 [Medicago truncatula]